MKSTDSYMGLLHDDSGRLRSETVIQFLSTSLVLDQRVNLGVLYMMTCNLETEGSQLNLLFNLE